LKRFLILTMLASSFAAGAGEIRFCIQGEPKTFDPLQVSEQNSQVIRVLTGGTLVRENRVTGRLEPQLAESWTLDNGGRAVTFHLRAGLKFSDGVPLTAADVARTLSTALDPQQASTAGDPFRSQQGNPTIQVSSPRDITIRYARPKPGLDRLFDSLPIVPPHPGKLPASAGPFFVSEYHPGEYVELKRNANYWTRVASDSMRVDIQPNRDIELARFLRGDIHLLDKLTPESFDRIVKEKPRAACNLGASFDSEFLWFNQKPSSTVPEWKRKWFISAAFRHAVSLSIRRADLCRVVYRGHAHPAAGPVSPANQFWFNAALKPLPFDARAAIQSLAAGGFMLRDGILRDHEGHAVEFSIITNSGNRSREAMATLIQADLLEIGIRLNIVTLDFGSLIERIMKTGQYEAALLGVVNVEADPVGVMEIWLSSGSLHAWWPSQKSPVTSWEARIDELEMEQVSEPSRDLRKKAFDEVQRVAIEQEPMIYLVNPDYLIAISPSLRGVQPTAAPPQILWNSEGLRLE
jgi:peptide/nickel transport system substrate-binding protein